MMSRENKELDIDDKRYNHSKILINKLPEKNHEYFHSILRKIEHNKTFNVPPQTTKNFFLSFPHNTKIYDVLIKLKSYSIFPKEIDHWTSHKNFFSIVHSQALLARKCMERSNFALRHANFLIRMFFLKKV